MAVKECTKWTYFELHHFVCGLEDCEEQGVSQAEFINEYCKKIKDPDLFLQDCLVKCTFGYNLPLVPILHANGIKYPDDLFEKNTDIMRSSVFRNYHSTHYSKPDDMLNVMTLLHARFSDEVDFARLITVELLETIFEIAMKYDQWVVQVPEEPRMVFLDDLMETVKFLIKLNPDVVAQCEDVVTKTMYVIGQNYSRGYFHELPREPNLRFYTTFVRFLVTTGFPLQCENGSASCLLADFSTILTVDARRRRHITLKQTSVMTRLVESFSQHGCDPHRFNYKGLIFYDKLETAHEEPYLEFMIPALVSLWTFGLRLGFRDSGVHVDMIRQLGGSSNSPGELHLAAIITQRANLRDDVIPLTGDTEFSKIVLAIFLPFQVGRESWFLEDTLLEAQKSLKFVHYWLSYLPQQDRHDVLERYRTTHADLEIRDDLEDKWKSFIQDTRNMISSFIYSPDSLKLLALRVVRFSLMSHVDGKRKRKYHKEAITFYDGDRNKSILDSPPPEHLSSDLQQTLPHRRCEELAARQKKLVSFYQRGLIFSDFLTEEVTSLGVPGVLIHYITGLEQLEQLILDVWEGVWDPRYPSS